GLAKGDEVVTDGGLMGKIVNIGDNAIANQLADIFKVEGRREAINSVMPKGTKKKGATV
ncbi:MAG: preprotein translocase subunit YajC, partial [Gammaproteobacteria bacterium]